MTIRSTLTTVIDKVSQNLVNVENALKQAEATIVQADEEAVAAARTLLAKFEHPQAAIQIIQNVAQLSALADTKTEMKAMIAALEVHLGSDHAVSESQKALDANEAVANSPLSESGSTDAGDTAVDTGRSSEAATPAA
jgi:predicted enzyme involved in methoxymalonyl-ACP biosynthesis